MKGSILVSGLSAIVCLAAIVRPHIGLISYFGFAIWVPQWNWRWTLPDTSFQLYIALATLVGFTISGFAGNRPRGASLWAAAGLTAYFALTLLGYLRTDFQPHAGWYADIFSKIWLMTLVGFVLLDSPRKVMALLWVVALAQGFEALSVNLEYFSLGYCRSAIYGRNFLDNNTYTLSTLPTMGVSVALLFFAQKHWQRYVAGGIFFLQCHQLMLMMSRGCFLGALVLGILVVVFVPKRWDTIGGLVAACFLVVVLAGPSVVEEFATIFETSEERDSSADSRFDLWQAGIRIVAAHPLLGVGPDCGRFVVAKFSEIKAGEKALHNLFFDVATGTGIFGLIAYLMFFGAVWFQTLRNYRRLGRRLPPWSRCASFAVLVGLPGYWVASMFSSSALVESPYILVVIGAATCSILARAPAAQTRPVIYRLDDWRKQPKAQAA